MSHWKQKKVSKIKGLRSVRVKTYFTAICYNLVRARIPDRIA